MHELLNQSLGLRLMPGRWIAARIVSLQNSRIFPPTIYRLSYRRFSSCKPTNAEVTPLRKKLKDAARASRSAQVYEVKHDTPSSDNLNPWELTVGIEIHAQLNTHVKLFSCTQDG